MNSAFRLPLILSLCLSHSLAAVRVEEVPEKGVQPEVATDGKGIVHLVYLRGDAKASEVRYTFRKPGEAWQKSEVSEKCIPGGCDFPGYLVPLP